MIQHGVLSELDANAIACSVSASESLSACLKRKGAPIDWSTIFRTFTKTVKEGGLYWDLHLQKQFFSKSITTESKGDDYLLPGATLPTQTRYAWTTNLALNLPLWGNLTLSPTWSEFFFEHQGEPSDRPTMHANTVKVVVRWFFGRDAGVPFRRPIRISR